MKTMKAGMAFMALAVQLMSAGCRTAPADGGGFREIILESRQKVFPTLVYIRVVREALEGGKNEKQVVAGSGVVISGDGELLTNHHVVDKATEIRCQLSDGTAYTAKKIGSDKDLDVALLKLNCPSNTHPFVAAELAPDPVSVGDVVLAMGAPWGLARSVTMGIISCTDRYLEGSGQYTLWYQTDAAIAPGNSGGPLVDTHGRVVGLNTRGNLYGGQAFTIPSPTILEVLPRLRKHGDAHWAWFGLNLQPLHDFNRDMMFPGDTGVVVAGTDVGSPARKAGLLPNDRIVAVGGQPATVVNSEDMPSFNRRLGRLPFGKAVEFSVVRGDKTLSFSIAPTEKGRVEGAQKAFERWGFTAKEINRFDTPDLAFFAESGGLFVSAVAWDGNAWSAGLKEKDVLLSWNGKPVKTLADLSRLYDAALKALPNKSRANIEVMRRGRKTQIVLNYLEDTEKEVLE
jgi:serine protease Do